MNHRLIAALKRLTAKKEPSKVQFILDVISGEDDCADPDSEYWNEAWDDYGEDTYDSKQDMMDRNSDDCYDDLGDTSSFFSEPKAVPSKTWLVHFTNTDLKNILDGGFKGADISLLGITGAKPSKGDHALAYDLKDLTEELFNTQEYGKNVVLFRAEAAVKAWHKGDDEYQVIFDVTTVDKKSMFGTTGDYDEVMSKVKAKTKSKK